MVLRLGAAMDEDNGDMKAKHEMIIVVWLVSLRYNEIGMLTYCPFLS